ncbi:MAG: Fic family protein [Deltaproteobacteria bacterium]|nr:Fic family protein [Deltaproteobacteria bacterium]
MASVAVNRYTIPRRWIRYDPEAVFDLLVRAKTAAGVLNRMPYLPQWIEQVHEEQLRLEAAGTSRIEGAEFTPREEEEALAPYPPVSTSLTHSQRQLRAADATYRWLRSLPSDQWVTTRFILDVHRRIVTGCDDDHCQPGALRPDGWNVTFGSPLCRGVEGGGQCRVAFDSFCSAIAGEFRLHDRIIQAIATHYHVGSMHPFGDGNGRTARALEAFMLRQAGVNDMVMVSLSNYYYEHKDEYLTALFDSRSEDHDLTPFLRFALGAVAERCNAVAAAITAHHERTLFREFARSLFGQLRSPRRRVLADRQLRVLEVLLDGGSIGLDELVDRVRVDYGDLKFPVRALARDLVELIGLSAIVLDEERVTVNLGWPQQFSGSELLARYESMPSAASTRNPAMTTLSQLLGRRRRRSGPG